MSLNIATSSDARDAGMADMDAGRAESEWKLGWRTLVAAFVGIGISWNVTLILASLFLKPMQSDFGWSRTQLSLGPMATLLFTITLPTAGIVLDRLGPRKTAIIGTCALSSAWMAMAVLPPNRTLFYLAVVYLSCTGALCNSIIFSRGLASWFDKRFGTAVGIASTGVSFAAMIFTPLLSLCIAKFGWRLGFAAMSITMLVVGLPFILNWFRTPERRESALSGIEMPRQSLRRIAKTVNFWLLITGSFIAALPIGGFLSNLMPLLGDMGLTISASAKLGSVFAVGIGIGTFGVGALLDRLNPAFVTSGTLALAACGAGALLFACNTCQSWTLMILPVLLLGVSLGAESDYITLFSIRLFGIENFSRILSIMGTVISVGMALGGLLFARIFDLFGTYRPGVGASTILYLAGALVFWTLKSTHDRSFKHEI